MAKNVAKRGKAKQKTVKKTRKELRKDKRKEKKSIKNEFFSRKKNAAGKFVSNPNLKDEKQSMLNLPKPVKPKKNEEQLKLEKEQRAALKKKREEKELRRARNKQLIKDISADDKDIKRMEKVLNLNRRKNKSLPKSYAMDGLAYVIEYKNEDHEDEFAAFKNNVQETGSEFAEDFAVATGQQRAFPTADFDSGHESLDDLDDSESDSDFDDCCSEMSDLTEGVGENVAAVLKKVFSTKADNKKERRTSKRKSDEMVEETSSKVVKRKTKKQKSVSFAAELDDSDEKAGQKSEVETVKRKEKKKKRELVATSDVSDKFDEDDDDDDAIVKVKKQKVSETHKSSKTKKNSATKTKNTLCKNVKEKENKVTTNESDEDFDAFGSDENDDALCEEETEEGKVWEDIYGRTRDTAGNILPSTKYVPPHLRDQPAGADKALLRLRAQMKGLLNRLAENNMKSIADQIEGFYMTHSRYNTSQTLTELLMGSLIAGALTPDRLVAEHVMLVAILHANVGTEVGAHLLQAVVTRFSEVLATNPVVEDKHLDNIVLIIAHLYNFKVFASDLAYDILNQLTEKFGEKSVELILLVLKTVGSNLRKDNPAALKDLISRMQTMAGSATNLADGTRVKFMMDVLLAIKNNNMTKIPNYDPSHADHLKKVLKSFLRQGNYVSELKISLQDLLKADERGRWWVVGSAWSGSEVKSQTSAPQNVHNYSAQVLALAKKQRMNTDARRNIFCIIMTAEDYLDAFEKLLHLGLKNQQEREIVHVIVDCCLQEKQFNPYYVHLAHKFCVFDRKYLMAIQYLLWDKLKDLGSVAPVQLTNLAKFLSHMFVEPQGLPLSVLKVIHFAEVDKPTVRLVRQTLLGLLLTDSEEACCAAFTRVAQAEKLHLFREGLRLFLHHFVLRNTQNLPAEDVEKLQARIAMADKALGSSHLATLF